MKILAVMGSPRKKGNTYRVVEQIKEHLMKYDGSIDFEYLFLRDQNLQMCTGCFNCIARGEDKCPLKDDRASIESKMLEADGIILASPSYAMGVTGIMKNFIDRFAYTLHRPRFFDKAFLAVTTIGGFKGIKQTLEQLAILSAGGKHLTKLGVAVPPIPMAGMDKKAAKNIRKASQAFYRSLSKPKKLPGFGDWAYFHAFKTFTDFQSYQKVCPADVAYYQDKEYFYPLKGHHLRRLAGKMLRRLMQSGFRLLIKED
jgi:multimeric flavodoxin WrbA